MLVRFLLQNAHHFDVQDVNPFILDLIERNFFIFRSLLVLESLSNTLFRTTFEQYLSLSKAISSDSANNLPLILDFRSLDSTCDVEECANILIQFIMNYDSERP
jgi:hypothetical protein